MLTSIKAEYIESRMRAGEAREGSQANADVSFNRFFLGGAPVEGRLVFDVRHEDENVGYLWIAPQLDSGPDKWWVWGIEIYEECQRHGYGRQAMILAEQTAKLLGANELGLNVFGYNTSACALYESPGYEPASVRMEKTL